LRFGGVSTVGVGGGDDGVESGDNGTDGDGDFGGGDNHTHDMKRNIFLILNICQQNCGLNSISRFV
jgi:hypothetical protein